MLRLSLRAIKFTSAANIDLEDTNVDEDGMPGNATAKLSGILRDLPLADSGARCLRFSSDPIGCPLSR